MLCMFVGRKKELEVLKKYVDGPSGAFLLYGKRRVGKTALIKESLKNYSFLYFQCYENSIEFNLLQFENALINFGVIKERINATSFSQIFYILNLLNKPLYIVIDEYCYLSTYTDSKIIDSDFQNICDNYLTNIHLIICGSQIRIMSSLLNEGNPLYGRIHHSLLLEELNYVEASYFYPNKDLYDKVAFYSIFGGSPFVLKEIDSSLSLKENIMNTFLTIDNDVFNYASKILFTDLSPALSIKELCSFLKNGKNTLTEIETGLGVQKNGNMFKRLKTLIEMGLLDKTNPINKLDNPKLSTYELKDNAIRFFYTFVYSNISLLEVINKDTIYDNYIANTINKFISFRFEEQVRQYYSLLSLSGKRNDIINIGRYHYNDKANRKNGEFDVALKLSNNTYDIVEVKYYKPDRLLTKIEMFKEKEQVKRITELDVNSVHFLSVSGYEKKDESCIDPNDLYSFDF